MIDETIQAALCIRQGSRNEIVQFLDDKLMDKDLTEKQVDAVMEVKKDISNIKDCEPESETKKGKGKAKKEKGTRKPSAYNIFVGKCLRGEVPAVQFTDGEKQPQKMKACAVEWKEEKKRMGN